MKGGSIDTKYMKMIEERKFEKEEWDRVLRYSDDFRLKRRETMVNGLMRNINIYGLSMQDAFNAL